MSGATSLAEWHEQTYGKRPALFTARRKGWCCWCGGLVADGDEACYWPDHDATIAHADCLRIVWRSHL